MKKLYIAIGIISLIGCNRKVEKNTKTEENEDSFEVKMKEEKLLEDSITMYRKQIIKEISNNKYNIDSVYINPILRSINGDSVAFLNYMKQRGGLLDDSYMDASRTLNGERILSINDNNIECLKFHLEYLKRVKRNIDFE